MGLFSRVSARFRAGQYIGCPKTCAVKAAVTAAGSWQDALLDAVVAAPRELPRARSVLARLARFAAGQGVPA
jgi:hypothetical protein